MALGKTNSPMKLNIANLHFNFQHYNKSIHVFSYLILSCLKLLAFKFLLNAGSTMLQHTYTLKHAYFSRDFQCRMWMQGRVGHKF